MLTLSYISTLNHARQNNLAYFNLDNSHGHTKKLSLVLVHGDCKTTAVLESLECLF